MVAGHLQEKQGHFYMVLSYNDASGKKKNKWKATGLPVKGNKKRAEAMLMETRQTFDPVAAEAKKASKKANGTQSAVRLFADNNDLLFSDFLVQWLKIAKNTVKLVTYARYDTEVHKCINPYFDERGITLVGLQASDIQNFYSSKLETLKATTVIHYHAIIHKALKHAVKMDLIPNNPADKVERPRKETFQAGFYDRDEINALFAVSKGTPLEIPIMLAAFYGLHRSEAVGLKWDCVDFERNTITIRHTVTCFTMDGKRKMIASDTTKTKSSMRTLPLVPIISERLMALKAEQEENRRLCGRSYCKDYLGYICVNEMGSLINPDYLTTSFSNLLNRHGLRHIRFHDLRHSCASMLLANGVAMKQIQEWLGHSDFSTTANIYAHLDYNSKLSSAQAMLEGLGMMAEG